MYRQGDEIHVSETEAKAGRKGSFLFQVLVLSLTVVLAVMAAIYVFGSETAPSQGGPVEAESAAAPG